MNPATFGDTIIAIRNDATARELVQRREKLEGSSLGHGVAKVVTDNVPLAM